MENILFIGYHKFVVINDKSKEGGIMKSKKTSKKTAENVKNILNTFLSIEANSTSCGIAYQPKAPKSLSRFRKIK